MSKKTEEILHIFEEIAKIPRCSGNEAQISAWLLNWAKEHQFEAKTDEVGNVLISIPASKGGYAKSQTVVLQGHLDMVCEKLPDSAHDFCRDAIQLVHDGEWLRADGTTLGADNGIAIALALALATDAKVKHPPLELLFTVEEETGMDGVKGLQPEFFTGKLLLNLDSEEEGTLIIGCAGSQRTDLSLPLDYEELPGDYRAYQLCASEMQGGHSGVEIDAQRANAIQITARVLDALLAEGDTRLTCIKGGTVGNAIPRDAEAILLVPETAVENSLACIEHMQALLRSEYKQTDPKLTLNFTPFDKAQDRRAMTAQCSRKAIDLLLTIPHGVAAMSPEIPGLVETSNNLATVTVADGRLQVLSSQRSSVFSRQQAHTNRIEAVARLAGGEAHSTAGSQPWEADWNSELVETCKKAYKRRFRKEPTVTVIHAGLECGMIGAMFEGMDMVSFGPTIENPHSPGERIEIESIEKIWDFLVTLLRALK